MGRSVEVEAWVSVDVDLEDIDTDDLIEELASRGEMVDGMEPADLKAIIERLWMKRRTGKDYQQELDDIIYNVIGRIA